MKNEIDAVESGKNTLVRVKLEIQKNMVYKENRIGEQIVRDITLSLRHITL